MIPFAKILDLPVQKYLVLIIQSLGKSWRWMRAIHNKALLHESKETVKYNCQKGRGHTIGRCELRPGCLILVDRQRESERARMRKQE